VFSAAGKSGQGSRLADLVRETMGQDLVGYRIDSEDRILFVSHNWLEFANRNGAPNLNGDIVIGRSLWDFVAGKETRYLSSLLFATARANQRTVSFSFRCDSPTCRRYARLSVAPLPYNGLEVSSETIREDIRPYIALLDPRVSRSGEFLTICSWCKRILLAGGEWAEVEVAVSRLDLFGMSLLPQLSHGVCGECMGKIDAECDIDSSS